MRRYLIIAAVFLFNTGCNTELPLPNQNEGRKIVLLGELVAEDSVSIRAGQSTPFAAGNGNELIHDLQVTIKDVAGATTALSEREDFNASIVNTVPFSSPVELTAGGNYRVAARHSTLGEVIADVSIPKAFGAKLKSLQMVSYGTDSALLFDIEIIDASAPNAFYSIEAIKQPVIVMGYFEFNGNDYLLDDNRSLYDSLKLAGIPVQERSDTVFTEAVSRVSLYTNDPLSDNASAGAGRQYKRIFFQGKAFGNAQHQTQVMIPRADLYTSGQLNQIAVSVKSVASDYYSFLKAYEQYDPSAAFGSNVTPGNLPGNIQGGLGMLGGTYRVTISVLH